MANSFGSWNDLNDEFNFTLDACTEDNNPLGIPKFYTKKDDELRRPWFNTTYCNPPYGRNNEVESLDKEKLKLSRERVSRLYAVLPSRTGNKWFHDYINNKPNVEIRFLPGRLRFRGAKSVATFDSMIVVFNGDHNSFKKIFLKKDCVF